MARSNVEISSLIAGAQRGDPECFDGLIDAYADRLYGYFCRSTGSRTVAEDLLQDLFLRLVQTIERYDHRERFEAFLFRIAGNLNRDRIRRARRSREKVRLADEIDRSMERDQPCGAATSSEVQVRDTLEQSERLDQMQAAMAKLPPAEREVIVLRHFSELSFKQIAILMDTPIGTALARAHRGLNKLRAMLAGTAND